MFLIGKLKSSYFLACGFASYVHVLQKEKYGLFHCYSLFPTPLLLIFLITNYRWICSDNLELKEKNKPFSVLQNFHIFNSFLRQLKNFTFTRIP